MALRFLSFIVLLLQANIGFSHEVTYLNSCLLFSFDHSFPCLASFISSSILPSQMLHSLRASNAAFADSPQGESFWCCKEYCVDTNIHMWSENECTTLCEEMTEDNLICVDTCKENSIPDIVPWDDCVCECTGNCFHKGSGVTHTGTPTVLYTRPPPPVPSPSSASSSSVYDDME